MSNSNNKQNERNKYSKCLNRTKIKGVFYEGFISFYGSAELFQIQTLILIGDLFDR